MFRGVCIGCLEARVRCICGVYTLHIHTGVYVGVGVNYGKENVIKGCIQGDNMMGSH